MVSKGSRFGTWLMPCSIIDLEEVYKIYKDQKDLSKSKQKSPKTDEGIYTELDTKSGRGWVYLDGSWIPSYKFVFLPTHAQSVYDTMNRGSGTIKWVNRPSLVEDFKTVAPKVAIVLTGLHILRIMAVRKMITHSNEGPIIRKSNLNNPSNKLKFRGSSIVETKPTVRLGSEVLTARFDLVAGQSDAKRDLEEIVDFLKNPEKYRRIGARMPRGALLEGHPGTGKTLLAKAVAGEAEVPFFSTSGSEFVEVFVGVGASRVRELFEEARKHDKAIIFIDEIDAIGKTRNMNKNSSDERESTLNQLLTEMDGFNGNDNIVVLAATNQKSVLDPALLRPGRFDRNIHCRIPNSLEREELFGLIMRAIKLDIGNMEEHEGCLDYMTNNDLKTVRKWISRLSSSCPLFSGADISNVVNEAAILAARNGNNGVTLLDLEQAMEKVIFGDISRGGLVSKERLQKVAIHEAGHALCSWYLPNMDPPIKVSTVPRSNGVLGYAQQVSDEEGLNTASDIRERLAVLLGGRVAEEIIYGEGSTGASDDLSKATKLARSYVSSWGFVDGGLITVADFDPSSDVLKSKSDKAVSELLNEAKLRAYKILEEHKHELVSLSKSLVKNEVVDFVDMYQIIGSRPAGGFSATFLHYLKHNAEEKIYSDLVNL